MGISSSPAFAQPDPGPEARDPRPGVSFVDPQRMRLDGPALRESRLRAPRERAAVNFSPPRTTHDFDFVPVAFLLAFPAMFGLARIGETLTVARRHSHLAKETDIARRVSIVVDAGTRRRIAARLTAMRPALQQVEGRSEAELEFVGMLRVLEGIEAFATHVGLETTLESPQNAATLVSRWQEELLETYASSSIEMNAASAVTDLPVPEGFVVLSILVHASAELPFPPDTLTRDNIPRLIASLEGPVGFLETFAVVWSPPDDELALSAEALSSAHPDLVPLDAETAAEQKTCRFCATRYAISATDCPTCGAPEDLEEARHSLEEYIHVEDVECTQCHAKFPSHRYRCPACAAHRFTPSGRPPPVERASTPPLVMSGSPSTPPPAMSGSKSTPPPAMSGSDPDKSV